MGTYGDCYEQALPSLHGGLLEMTLSVPLIGHFLA